MNDAARNARAARHARCESAMIISSRVDIAPTLARNTTEDSTLHQQITDRVLTRRRPGLMRGHRRQSSHYHEREPAHDEAVSP